MTLNAAETAAAQNAKRDFMGALSSPSIMAPNKAALAIVGQ